jgi:hypothetical protein
MSDIKLATFMGFIFGLGCGCWIGSWMGESETKREIYYQAHRAGLGEYQISPVTGRNEFKWKVNTIKED